MVLSSFTLGDSMISFDNTTQSYIVTIYNADGSTKEIQCKNYQTAISAALLVAFVLCSLSLSIVLNLEESI